MNAVRPVAGPGGYSTKGILYIHTYLHCATRVRKVGCPGACCGAALAASGHTYSAPSSTWELDRGSMASLAWGSECGKCGDILAPE